MRSTMTRLPRRLPPLWHWPPSKLRHFAITSNQEFCSRSHRAIRSARRLARRIIPFNRRRSASGLDGSRQPI